MPVSLKAENSQSATRFSSGVVPFLAISVIGCLADLLSKQATFAWLGLPLADADHTRWLISDYAGIQTAVNRGALFGMFQGFTLLFAILSIGAAAGILVWLFKHGAIHDRLLAIALGCVMAGIAGNLYDRLGFWHAADTPTDFQYGVRDWILLQWPGVFTWPNFNIADSGICVGVALVVLPELRTLFQKRKPDGEPPSPGANPSSPR